LGENGALGGGALTKLVELNRCYRPPLVRWVLDFVVFILGKVWEKIMLEFLQFISNRVFLFFHTWKKF